MTTSEATTRWVKHVLRDRDVPQGHREAIIRFAAAAFVLFSNEWGELCLDGWEWPFDAVTEECFAGPHITEPYGVLLSVAARLAWLSPKGGERCVGK